MGRWPRRLAHLTRREALGMLGAGAGLTLTAGPGRAAPAQQAATDIAFPAGAVIRTVTRAAGRARRPTRCGWC